MARLKIREAYWRKRVQYLRRAEKRATKHSTKQTARVAPNRRSAAFYDRYFATYDKIYFDLKDRFAELAALPG